MLDNTDPILDAVDALRAADIVVAPIGEELEWWQIGDLNFSDADVVRLAESRGLIRAT